MRITHFHIPTYFAGLSLRAKIFIVSGVIFLLVAVVAGYRLYTVAHAADAALPVQIKSVLLLPAGELAQSADVLAVTGTLRSMSEADLRFEVPGRVTNVYATVGQRITSGTLIAEVENSAQRAAVTQALGGLQAAEAQAKAADAALAKVRGGTRQEQLAVLDAGVTSAEDGYVTAVQSARNTLSSTYAAVSQAVINGTDTLFDISSRYNPRYLYTTKDLALTTTVENERMALWELLDREHSATTVTTADSALIDELSTVLHELEQVNSFYARLLTLVDKSLISDAQKSAATTIVSQARASIIMQISAVTATRNALLQAANQVTIAEANRNQGVTGAQSEDVQAAEAQADAAHAAVTSARGSYAAAVAMLNKTRIHAPISGTLASFSATVGDFVGTQMLGKVVGTGGSEVVFHIPDNDTARVSVGDTVLVADAFSGTVTSVATDASGLSGQLEVRAQTSGDIMQRFVNGSTVSIHIRNTEGTAVSTSTDVTALLVPLNTVKFTASETSLFTVVDSHAATSTLVAVPVTLGTVVGTLVTVSGVTADTPIVTDARGLIVGQTVLLSNPITK